MAGFLDRLLFDPNRMRDYADVLPPRPDSIWRPKFSTQARAAVRDRMRIPTPNIGDQEVTQMAPSGMRNISGDITDIPAIGPWELFQDRSTVEHGPWEMFGALPEGVAPAQPSMLADVAKSGGIGLVKGINSMLGIGGDIQALAGAAGKKLGLNTTGYTSLPTSAGVQRAEEMVTGPFYRPQTTAGKYAETVGEFLPGAVALPGGIASRAANAIRYGAIPGVASEAAGQATEGTAAEPWARAGAGVLGAIGGPSILKGAGRAIGVIKKSPMPSVEEIKESAQANYEKAFAEPVALKQEGVQKLAGNVGLALSEFGYHPKLQTALNPALEELGAIANRASSTLKELDTVRRIASHAATNVDPSTRAATHLVTDKIDSFLRKIEPSDIAGDFVHAGDAATALTEVRRGWNMMRKTEIVQDIIENATRTAESTGSGGNINNALRQGFKNVLNNPKRARIFSTEERDAFRAVSKGAPLDQAARLIGKLGPEGNGLMLAVNLLHAGINPSTGIPLAAVGLAAKRFADTATKSRATEALAKVAGQSSSKNQIVTKFGVFPRTKAGARALAAAQAVHLGIAPQDQQAP